MGSDYEAGRPGEVPNPDDDMDRIDDIGRVRAGDVEVTKGGNHYKVVDVDYDPDADGVANQSLRVCIPGTNDAYIWMYDALRPKSAIPTEPATCGCLTWMAGMSMTGLRPLYAPYTRIELKENQ